MNPYLFAYSSLCPDDTAQAILDETKAVPTWVRPFPHAAIVLSDLAIADLSAVLHRRLGDTWFLLTALGRTHTDGWVPANLWNYVNHTAGTPVPTLPASHGPAPGYLLDGVVRQADARSRGLTPKKLRDQSFQRDRQLAIALRDRRLWPSLGPSPTDLRAHADSSAQLP